MKKWNACALAILVGAIIYAALPAVTSAMERSTDDAVESQTASPPSAQAAGQPHDAVKTDTGVKNIPEHLAPKVNEWIRTLAADNHFTEWKDAQWTSSPLGPGMHGWIIILQKDGKEVGYLVVNAAPDGQLLLTEYGTGKSPLFSYDTLYHSLMQHGLISDSITLKQFMDDEQYTKQRIYIDALHAVWEIPDETGKEPVYVDAKTGEILPLSAADLKEASVTLKEDDNSVKEKEVQDNQVGREAVIYVKDSFSPYSKLNWIVNEPMNTADFITLQKALHEPQHITMAAKVFGGKILAPYAVIGYMLLDNTPYVILEDDGPRYVPFAALKGEGNFYR